MNRLTARISALLLVLAGLASARADSVADFYSGRTIDLEVGYSTGGGYDIYARHRRHRRVSGLLPLRS